MKIGIDIRSIGRKRTGDETYTKGLIKGLLSIDEENEYFLYTDTNNQDEMKKIRLTFDEFAERKNVSIIPVLPSSKFFWTFFALPTRAKKDKLDILHVQYITPIFLSKKIRLVTTIHDVSYKRYPQFIGAVDLFFLNLFIPISLRRADAVIGVSDFTKNEIIDCYKIDKRKIWAINNGHGQTSSTDRAYSIQEKQEFRNKKGLNNPFIFYLGTLQPRKNVPFLIKSFVYLKRKYSESKKIKELEFVIRGSMKGKNIDPKIMEELDEIDDKTIRESIKFIDYIDASDLSIYYQCSEAYVNASLYEGFGLPLIESMAQGTPVICSSDSCYPEITGKAAMMFKNNDKEDFAKKVFKVLNNDETSMKLIEKGKINAKRFSWKKNAMQTLKLYDTIWKDKAQ